MRAAHTAIRYTYSAPQTTFRYTGVLHKHLYQEKERSEHLRLAQMRAGVKLPVHSNIISHSMYISYT